MPIRRSDFVGFGFGFGLGLGFAVCDRLSSSRCCAALRFAPGQVRAFAGAASRPPWRSAAQGAGVAAPG